MFEKPRGEFQVPLDKAIVIATSKQPWMIGLWHVPGTGVQPSEFLKQNVSKVKYQTHAHQIKAELKRRGRKESEQQLALQIRCKDLLASCLFVVLFAECLPRVLAFLYCREFSRSGMQPGLRCVSSGCLGSNSLMFCN